MITFTEYLNEAYTADMKKYIPTDKLKGIGDYLAKKGHMSVQDIDFVELKKGWKIKDYEARDYAIWEFDTGLFALTKRVTGGKAHEFVYPEHVKGYMDGSMKKNVKHVWVFDGKFDNSIRNKQWDRRDSQKTNDKLDDIQKKMHQVKSKGTYEQIKKLAEKAWLYLWHGYIRSNGDPYVSISQNYDVNKYDGIDCEIHYSNNKWYADIKFKNIKFDKLDECKKRLEEYTKLAKELEKIDLSMLPLED
jgi:hypothetical protein